LTGYGIYGRIRVEIEMKNAMIALMLSSSVAACQPNIDGLLRAIATVESGNNPNAFNASENAAGLYQIRPIYLKDVNRIVGHDEFTLADRYEPERAEQMVRIYFGHYGKGKSLEQLARIHNGGPRGDKKESTKSYWLKVQEVLNEKTS